jgi:hypothetical protein
MLDGHERLLWRLGIVGDGVDRGRARAGQATVK